MGNDRDNEGWAVILSKPATGQLADLIFFPIRGNGLRRQHRYPPIGVDSAGLRRVCHETDRGFDLRAPLDRMGLSSWLGICLHLGQVFDVLALFVESRGWAESPPPSSWRTALLPQTQTGWIIELGAEGLTYMPFAAVPRNDEWVHRCGPPQAHLGALPEATAGWITGLDHGDEALAVYSALAASVRAK